jgi:hypothetical protein
MSTRAIQSEHLLAGLTFSDGETPIANGTVEFYGAGLTPDPGNALDAWLDKDKVSSVTSITLDADGKFLAYFDGVYKWVIKDKDGNEVETLDNLKFEARNTNTVTKIADYTTTTDDDYILVDATTGDVIITLYPAADSKAPLTIKRIDTVSTNTVTVDANGSETIDGQLTVTISVGGATQLVSDGTQWFGAVSQGTVLTSDNVKPTPKDNGDGTFNIYDVSPFRIETMGYAGKVFDFSSQAAISRDIHIGDSGNKLYVLDSGSNVYQYTLATPYDLSSASYDNKLFNVATQDNLPRDVFFKPDGLEMYIIGTSSDKIHQYTLTTAWDVTTASFTGSSAAVTGQDANPFGLFIGSSGSKAYMCGAVTGNTYQYTLSTPWDATTLSYDTVSLATSTEDSSPQSIHFSDDGQYMFMMGSATQKVYQYISPSPFSIVTMEYSGVSFNLFKNSPPTSAPGGIVYDDQGRFIYMVEQDNDSVQYYAHLTHAPI